MTLAQHTDYKVRYQQQVDNAREFLIPFILSGLEKKTNLHILDIGCGEGGVLIPFLEQGNTAVGIELDEIKSGYAKELLAGYIADGKTEIINKNIYDDEALKSHHGKFDLIILKDVIEHIPRQEVFIPYMKKFLKPGGHVFFGFPPWYMPHGGHQQVCSNKFLSMLPYVHLLPNPVYKGVLKMFGEHQSIIDELIEVKSTGISIERFEKLIKSSDYSITKKTFFLFNPIYKYKFGVKPRKQAAVISAIPWVRDFVTTCVYYLVRSE